MGADVWRRATTCLLTLAVVGTLATACTGEQRQPAETPGAVPADQSTANAPGADPRALVGTWRVSVSGGNGRGRLLSFTGRELRLKIDCGDLGGAWEGDSSGMFVAYVWFSSGHCARRHGFDTPTWLAAVTSFAVVGDTVELRDDRGDVTAVLQARSTPEGSRPGPSSRRPTGQPVPLPADLRPATEDELVRRMWIPEDWSSLRRAPFVRFERDGGLAGSDGCNGQYGRYTLGSDGSLLAVHGGQTLIGCEGAPVASWVDSAAWAGLDGDTLVLVGEQGKELARLRAAPLQRA